MTLDACKLFSGSTAVWTTFTDGGSPEQQKAGIVEKDEPPSPKWGKDDVKDMKNDNFSLRNIDLILLNWNRF